MKKLLLLTLISLAANSICASEARICSSHPAQDSSAIYILSVHLKSAQLFSQAKGDQALLKALIKVYPSLIDNNDPCVQLSFTQYPYRPAPMSPSESTYPVFASGLARLGDGEEFVLPLLGGKTGATIRGEAADNFQEQLDAALTLLHNQRKLDKLDNLSRATIVSMSENVSKEAVSTICQAPEPWKKFAQWAAEKGQDEDDDKKDDHKQ